MEGLISEITLTSLTVEKFFVTPLFLSLSLFLSHTLTLSLSSPINWPLIRIFTRGYIIGNCPPLVRTALKQDCTAFPNHAGWNVEHYYIDLISEFRKYLLISVGLKSADKTTSKSNKKGIKDKFNSNSSGACACFRLLMPCNSEFWISALLACIYPVLQKSLVRGCRRMGVFSSFCCIMVCPPAVWPRKFNKGRVIIY